MPDNLVSVGGHDLLQDLALARFTREAQLADAVLPRPERPPRLAGVGPRLEPLALVVIGVVDDALETAFAALAHAADLRRHHPPDHEIQHPLSVSPSHRCP